MPRLTPADRVTRHKSSAIEYSKRVETVRRLILSGMDTDAIIQNVTAEYGVVPRMARKYITVAQAKNQAFVKFHEADMYAEHISIRRDIRRRAQAAGDRKTELASARDEALLMGLYKAAKLDVAIHDWREAAKAQGIPDADIEAATEQAAEVFSRLVQAGAEKPAPVGEAGMVGENTK